MINGNEPAMPIVEDNNIEGQLIRQSHYSGLTIRQQFAVMCLQGFLSSASNAWPNPALFAAKSVEAADALINELNKQQ